MKALFLIHDFVVENLGLGYLSSALKKAGHEVRIIKSRYKSSMNSFIEDWQPDILAFSVTTGWHSYYQNLNREIRQWYKKGKSIFGGPHATYMPEMINEDGVDIVMRGECEQSIVDLLDVVDAGPGRYKRVVEPYPLKQDLDKIEFPDRELLYSYPENKNNPIFNVMMSRGCIYQLCSYCYASINKEMYKGQKIIRWRSSENVIEECKQVKKDYPEKKFAFFQDDEFIMRQDLLAKFLEIYIKEIGLPFHCQIRIDMINRDMATLLRIAGCVSVTFSIESGNEKIRNKLLKKGLDDIKIYEGCEILKEVGLKYRSENMIGLPGETIEEALQTLDMNRKIGGDYNWVSLYQPYPKTELGEYSKNLRLWDGNISDIRETFFESSPLKIERKNEFINLQRIFNFAIRMKIPTKIVRLLIKLPPNILYDKINKWEKKIGYEKLYGY